MFSNYGKFNCFAEASMNVIKLYLIGFAFAYFTACILSVKYFFEFLKISNRCTNSPRFEKVLPGNDLAEYFKVALHVKIKPQQ